MKTLAVQHRTVFRLLNANPDRDLVGYDFESKREGEAWIAQYPKEGWWLRAVAQVTGRRKCQCCGAVHWTDLKTPRMATQTPERK